MAFFPDAANTSFDIPTTDPPMTLVVEGQEASREAANAIASTSSPPSTSTTTVAAVSTPSRPGSSAGPSHTGGTPAYRRPTVTCNIKVVKARLKRLPSGRPDFTPLGQLFIDLTDNSANVDHVLAAVQRHWGVNQALVTADGLKIEDSSGTQGKIQ